MKVVFKVGFEDGVEGLIKGFEKEVLMGFDNCVYGGLTRGSRDSGVSGGAGNDKRTTIKAL